MAEQPVYESENITMCTDGKYRWVYELNLYKNPAIIKEVGRVIFISLVIVLALIFGFVMIDGIGTFSEKHIKKAELIGAITVIAGIASGRPGVVGTGMLASARTSMYTRFDSVKELEIVPKQHLIRLNGTLKRNQVYAEDEDFAFVADFIASRCRNAKVIRS